MIDPVGAVYARLNADDALVAMSDVIFHEDTPPANHLVGAAPTIIIATPHDQSERDDFTDNYRETALRIRLYSKPDGSALVLDQAAEAVRASFKTWPKTAIANGELVGVLSVEGPTPAPTDDPTISGRIVSVRLYLKEN